MNAVTTDALWMPFTANRDFKKQPRVICGAEGHHYTTTDGRRLYDTFSGLWTSGVGHCHPKIVAAVQKQVAELDYAMVFQMGNDKSFALAEKVIEMAPEGFSNVFFTNSGSESVDTALKIALAYHRAKGEGHRTRLIGREKGYHGVNFGGMSVGGIVPNRKVFSAALLPGVDHLRHTLDIGRNAFSRGMPEHGAELADDLERLCVLHDGSNIAAVIVEPIAGSAGVLLPPKGYLEKLRAICDRHGVLLIFDEVVTAFRIGISGAQGYFGVKPDLTVFGKVVAGGYPAAGGLGGSTDLMEYLGGMVENSADIIITVEPVGRVEKFNRGAGEAMGYDRIEAIEPGGESGDEVGGTGEGDHAGQALQGGVDVADRWPAARAVFDELLADHPTDLEDPS